MLLVEESHPFPRIPPSIQRRKAPRIRHSRIPRNRSLLVIELRRLSLAQRYVGSPARIWLAKGGYWGGDHLPNMGTRCRFLELAAAPEPESADEGEDNEDEWDGDEAELRVCLVCWRWGICGWGICRCLELRVSTRNYP